MRAATVTALAAIAPAKGRVTDSRFVAWVLDPRDC